MHKCTRYTYHSFMKFVSLVLIHSICIDNGMSRMMERRHTTGSTEVHKSKRALSFSFSIDAKDIIIQINAVLLQFFMYQNKCLFIFIYVHLYLCITFQRYSHFSLFIHDDCIGISHFISYTSDTSTLHCVSIVTG